MQVGRHGHETLSLRAILVSRELPCVEYGNSTVSRNRAEHGSLGAGWLRFIDRSRSRIRFDVAPDRGGRAIGKGW